MKNCFPCLLSLFWLLLTNITYAHKVNVDRLILKTAKEFNISPELVKAIILTESSGNIYALHLSSPQPIGWKLRKEGVSYIWFRTCRKHHYTILPENNKEKIVKLIKWAEKNKNIDFDIGLMQINKAKIRDLQKKYPKIKAELFLDPYVNIVYGSYILKKCLKKYGEIELAIECYHRGKAINGKSLYVKRVVSNIIMQD